MTRVATENDIRVNIMSPSPISADRVVMRQSVSRYRSDTCTLKYWSKSRFLLKADSSNRLGSDRGAQIYRRLWFLPGVLLVRLSLLVDMLLRVF